VVFFPNLTFVCVIISNSMRVWHGRGQFGALKYDFPDVRDNSERARHKILMFPRQKRAAFLIHFAPEIPPSAVCLKLVILHLIRDNFYDGKSRRKIFWNCDVNKNAARVAPQAPITAEWKRAKSHNVILLWCALYFPLLFPQRKCVCDLHVVFHKLQNKRPSKNAECGPNIDPLSRVFLVPTQIFYFHIVPPIAFDTLKFVE
jgi:hypothetical protein